MDNYYEKTIEISSLLLSLDNPRFDRKENQDEALNVMIKAQGEKLVNLAKHIVKKGTNPSELTIVTPCDKTNRKYYVLEGNRRVAALKFILNPSLLSDKEYELYYSKFDKLNREFHKNRFEKLKCIVYSDRNEAYDWITLKHTGENEGVGIVRWGSTEKARFNARYGKSSYALQVMDFLRDHGGFAEEDIDKISITNLERIIGDPSVRDAIGIDLHKGELRTKMPKKEVIKGLNKIVNDLIDDSFNVKSIYHKMDRKKYVDKFEQNDLPNKTKADLKPWSLIEYSDEVENTKVAKRKKRKKGKITTLARNTLVPKTFDLEIKDGRINNIFDEMKRLNVGKFPNSTAILFRVFLELSLESFIKKTNLPHLKPEDTLKKKFQQVTEYMKNSNRLNKNQLKPLNTATSNKETFLSIDTLHSYIHNESYNPTPIDLKTAWDNFMPFFEKLWE